MCISIFKKIETVNSRYTIFEKEIRLRNLTTRWNEQLHHKQEHTKQTEGYVNYTHEYV